MVPADQAVTQADAQHLGEALVAAGSLSGTDLSRAMQLRQQGGGETSLAALLVRLGMVSEADIATQLAALTGWRLVATADFPEQPLLQSQLSYRFLKENHLLPLQLQDGCLQVAMADPASEFNLSAVAFACGESVQGCIGIASELDAAIERLYGEGQSQMGDILAGVDEEEASDQDIEQLKDMASEAPVIRLVNLIIQQAAERRASDIHIEPFENRLRVRYRVDGLLVDGEAPPVHLSPAVISRVKIMARLNIAERRLPQDGRIEMRLQGRDLDIRVSTVPTLYGESVVLRLLDREAVALDFDALGYDTALVDQMNKVLSQPHGMLIVTGPTGSGKSTTLYTALSQLNTEQRKLITVEDPVEYQIEGVNQIQVKSGIGLNFASALRAIVRQDPDVIMVGEMRDLETARICVQSALTGHIVLSTLHTNDAAGSITRLLEMGVEDYLLTSTLNAAVGQRLVRRLCDHCREPWQPLPEAASELGLASDAGVPTLYRAKGCEHCGGSGYRGRIAITELLVMNDKLRQRVLQRADATTLMAEALQQGMRSLYQDGCIKALAGLTSIEEVIRVTQEA